MTGWIIIQMCCLAQLTFAEIAPDFLMDSDPELQLPPPVQDYDPNLTVLWMQALERPDTDLQRMAAETIARAQSRGVPELSQAIPRLEEIVSAGDSHPATRFAAARALISLESKDSSDKLFQASQTYGSDLRQLVEPALAAWDDSSAKQLWIERLTSTDTRVRDLDLAIRGLGEVRDQSALPDLMQIVNDSTSNAALRLEAATAAGKIAESGLEQQAKSLMETSQSGSHLDRLCAIRLLHRHSSEEAVQLLVETAGTDEPAVVAAALQRLNEIDSSLVLPLAESAIQSSDWQVRRQGVQCMFERPAVSHVEPLAELLADPHPGLRHRVCEGLFRLSEQPNFEEPVRDAATRILMADRWQGHQEASLLLGALEHDPAAGRLLELLDSPRFEVRIPAAWALRKIALPETASSIMEAARRLEQQRNLLGDKNLVDQQIAHLFEAIGVIGLEDAIPLLLEYIPKTDGPHYRRGAAIWAIGRIKAGTRDSEIEDALVARILDFAPRPLESMRVKRMSAIALARMQAVEHAEMMKQYTMKEQQDAFVSEKALDDLRLHLALNWSFEQLTGEELPPPNPLISHPGTWFLEPLN